MKPLILTMQAFGPFGDKCEISFENMGTRGIFLISGDTGAGKTTIFDGICFALFGEASGDNRKTDSMRSGFAKRDIPTKVRLVFLHRGKRYEITRNPEYLRPSKRGNGETKESQNACLIYPDDSQVVGFKQVTQAMIDLLGVDKKQFKQISMIAQGEFMKLLNSSSEDRSLIFRNVFNTNSYYQLSQRLSQKERELARQCADFDKSMEQYLSEIITEEESFTEVSELPTLIEQGREKANLAKEEKELHTARLKEREEKLSQWQKNGEAITRCNRQINENTVSLERLNKKLLESKKLREEMKKEAETFELLLQEITKEESELTQYKQREDARQKLSQIQSQSIELEEEAELIRGSLDSLALHKNEEHEKVETYSEAPVLLERLTGRTSGYDEKEKNFQLAYQKIKESEKLTLELTRLQEETISLEKELELQQHERQEMEKQYYHQQAGILAENLAEGEPCPVCGSVSHPHKAVLSGVQVSKEELDKAHDREDNLRTKWQNKSIACSEKRGEIQKCEAGISKECIPYEEKFKEFQKEKNEWKHELDEASRQKTIYEKALRRERELTAECEAARLNQKEMEDKLSDSKLVKQQLTLTLESYDKQLTYADQNAAQDKLKEKREKYESYQQRVNHINETYEKELREQSMAEGEAVQLSNQLKQLEKEHLDFGTVDVEQWQQAIVTEKDELAKAEEKHLKYHNMWKVNERIYEQVTALLKNQGELQKHYLIIKNLSETANGNLTGKEKVDFEKYVQSFYFRRVVTEANKRLRLMGGGQYELRCRENASNMRAKSGLELEIMDYYIGALRPVGSLSGGESFQAALALALGMSDVMQRTAGGIEIDAMFIDEGFGSLDSTALEQAIGVLMQLADGDRMVGIISHVAELKERIDRKIEITKTSEGSLCKMVL